MNELDQLATKFNTDKKPSWHNYTPIYESLFEHLKFRGLTMLEIGVSEGASIKMWGEYFTNAKIYGIDIVPYFGELPYDAEFILCDQRDANQLQTLISETGNLDIIIDDGNHHIPDMLQTLDTLFPYLNDGGYYCIEDVQHYKEFNLNLDGKYNYWTAVSNSKVADNSHIIIIRK